MRQSILVMMQSWTSICEEPLPVWVKSATCSLHRASAYPLTWLRTIGLRLKNIIVAVIVLTFLIPEHIEGLQDTHMFKTGPDFW